MQLGINRPACGTRNRFTSRTWLTSLIAAEKLALFQPDAAPADPDICKQFPTPASCSVRAEQMSHVVPPDVSMPRHRNARCYPLCPTDNQRTSRMVQTPLIFPVLACAIAVFAAPIQPALAQSADEIAARTLVEQVGDDTSVRVQHEGTGNQTVISQAGRDLAVDVEITGANNGATSAQNSVTQTGVGSTASIAIVGDDNRFTVNQDGAEDLAANNTFTASINGSGNSLDSNQTNLFGEQFFNTGGISQTGAGNSASLSQEIDPRELIAGGNVASISQNGLDHIARIMQAGSDNTATIDQAGDGNLAVINQDGTGLQAVLEQDGSGLNYEINQTGCALSGGCAPVIIRQTGP
jgi:hypothetical protein